MSTARVFPGTRVVTPDGPGEVKGETTWSVYVELDPFPGDRRINGPFRWYTKRSVEVEG